MATDVSVCALFGYDSQHAASAKPDVNRTLPTNALHTESTRLKPWPYPRAAFNAMPLRPLANEKPIALITLVILMPSKNLVIKSASFVAPVILRIVASFR